jgi:hypothetical protein
MLCIVNLYSSNTSALRVCFSVFFQATPKRRKVFVLHALHGSLHELNNDFLFFRATPKRRRVFVLHALHGALHKFYK